MDALLLLAPVSTSIGYAGRGDFTMAADGRLTRRGEREVAPFVYAGAAILRPELFKDAPDGRLLADDAVRPRRGERPAAWAAARRRVDARRHAGGHRGGRGGDRGQRGVTRHAGLINSSAYLWRLGQIRIARMRRAMTQCERHGPHAPRVFTIPASAPFLPTLIEALMEDRLGLGFKPGADPLALAAATIYLPTRRACRLAQKIFLDVLKRDAAILPRIVPIGDVDEDEIAFAEAAIGETAARRSTCRTRSTGFERKVLLAEIDPEMGGSDRAARRAATRRCRQQPGGGAGARRRSRAADGRHGDAAGAAGIGSTSSCRPTWTNTGSRRCGFLKIRPRALAARSWRKRRIEPAERRDKLIAAEAKRLETSAGPVIAAGSTGSIPATATLLATIAKLPHGALVLPGLDTDLDDATWSMIAGRDGDSEAAHGHPQFAMSALLQRIGIVRDSVDCARRRPNRMAANASRRRRCGRPRPASFGRSAWRTPVSPPMPTPRSQASR